MNRRLPSAVSGEVDLGPNGRATDMHPITICQVLDFPNMNGRSEVYEA